MNPRITQRIGFACWGALALLQVIWHACLLPPARMPIAVALAIALIPLTIPLLYWKHPQRALILAAMIGLFYFCHGVAEAYSAPHGRALAWIELLLVVVLVLSLARMPKRKRTAPE